jgi:hypothetical protein
VPAQQAAALVVFTLVGSHVLRPRPFAIVPTPATPRSANRFRHRRTASESTPERRAISSFATHSAAHNNARAWTT